MTETTMKMTNANFAAKIDKSTAIDAENYIISFIALSHENTNRREFLGEQFYLNVDVEKMEWKATRLYADHNVSFDTALGKIIDVKRENGDIKVKVQFFEEIPASREAFLKYKNGLSDSVSVGICDIEFDKKTEKLNDLPLYTAIKGTIYELSAVWEGADSHAKIAEFKKQNEKNNLLSKGETLAENIVQNENVTTAELSAEATTQNVGLSSAEIANIAELGEIAGKADIALQCIKEGVSYTEASKRIAEAQKNDTLKASADFAKFNIARKIDDTEKGFSLGRAVRSLASNQPLQKMELARLNGSTGRISIPNNYQFDLDTNASTTTTAPGAIAETREASWLVRQLHESSKIIPLCNVKSGLKGVITFPVDNTIAKAYWVEEGKSPDYSKLEFSTVTIRPKTLSVGVQITRNLLNMSDLDLTQYIRETMILTITDELEKNIIDGDGTTTGGITGLNYTSNTQTYTGFFTSPSIAKVQDVAKKTSATLVDLDKCHFLLNTTDALTLSAVEMFSATNGNTLYQNGKLCGYNTADSHRITTQTGWFGDFKNIILGFFGNVEFNVLPQLGGNLTFEIFFDTDMAVTRPNSFVKLS